MSLALSIIALTSYAVVLSLLLTAIYGKRDLNRRTTIVLALLGGASHLAAGLTGMISHTLWDFSLVQSGSLILAVTATLVALGCLRDSLQIVLLFVVPPAMVALATTLLVPPTKLTALPASTAAHVVFSILAYGVIILAASFALTLQYGTMLLKSKRINLLLELFPPMETIDRLLFQMIVAGQVLLSFSILSGLLFVDDFFSQRLIHKTFFSLLSWVIFGILILGHYLFGWRGSTAIRWTFAGFIALLLAYIGSKVVIELVLN